MSQELMVRYESNGQEITLTQNDVKNFLVTGDADKVTDKELKLIQILISAYIHILDSLILRKYSWHILENDMI